jgi:hypothetical protein
MIFITKIDNHKEINKNLLKLINKIKNPIKHTTGSSIFNTDWNLPEDYKRDYLIYFYEIIKPYMNKIADKLHSKKWIIHNSWFQQYLKSDSHDWHTHVKSNFANVYFVELPNKCLGTEIFKYKKLKVKTGDLLTFPAYYFHRSPMNNLNKRKTIISFNSSFEEFNGKI